MRFIPRPRLILTILFALSAGFFITTYAQLMIAEIRGYNADISNRYSIRRAEKPDPIFAKGLYLTASSAANEKKRKEIIDLINSTELNAVVIDIKDYSGYILYDSGLQLVNELKTERPTLKNIQAVLSDFKKNGIYTIARQTVFQDPVLAQTKPEWAIKTESGAVWRDFKGLSWVDPTLTEVWDYNLAISREAAHLGFDEINFDYVRFPSDGNISTARYANLYENKEQTMQKFFGELRKKMTREPVFTSLDLFGLVLEAHTFDMNIGQRLEIAKDMVDYICPMTYPSHYPSGHLGFANPAEHPYEVVSNGLKKGHSVMEGSRTKLRPWLQAFDLGSTYDAAKIRAEITAAEESDQVAGWLIWNAANRYTPSGLAKDAGEQGRQQDDMLDS